MVMIVADRVAETSTSIGTGPYVLLGALIGFRPASDVCTNGDTFTYFAEDVDAGFKPSGAWETGLGTWVSGSLSRTIIYNSSNGGSAISWGPGTRKVALSLLANASLGPTNITGALSVSGAINSSNLSGTNTGDNAVNTSATPITHIGSGDTSHAIVVAAGPAGFMTGADKTKLDNIAPGATAYSHPANHAPSIITQDASNRFVTDAQVSTWNAKQPAGNYATGGGTATGTNTGDQTLPTTLPTPNAVVFTNSGGNSAGTSFNGSAAKTVDYSTVGAAPVVHTHSYQAADGDLLAIGGLVGTSGLLRKNAADTWSLDTTNYATGGGTATGTNTGDQTDISGSAGFATYGRYVYNNGAYSGSGWVEASDLGVRYASTSGSSTNSTNATFQLSSVVGSTCLEIFQNTPAGAISSRECVGWGDAPNTGWWVIQSIRHTNSANIWGTQIAYGWEDNGNLIYQRNVSAGSWSGWSRVDVSSANITELVNNAGFITSASIPTSLPASDVYAWAKASVKPTYTKAEVGLGNVDNTADSSKSVSYANTAGSATDSTKLPLAGGTMSGFLTISSSAGGDFYTAYKLGAGYGDSSGACYLAKTDNTNGAANFFHKGFAGTTATFSIRADGQIASFGSEGKAVVSYLAPSYSVGDIVSGHSYHWYSDNWRIGGSRGGGTDMADFKFQLNGVDKLRLNVNGDLTAIGSIAAANISTGITANHIVQRDGSGYIMASHINLSTTETENATLNSFITSNGDGWTRKASKAHVISQLGLITSGNIGSQSVSYANTAGSATDSSKLPLTGGTISGNLTVTGEIAAASKSFLIPHPTKQGMKLRYGSLESPYHGVRLTGNGVLVKGKCRIDLPEYISKLCKQEGSQVQLTNIKHSKVVWVDNIDIENNIFDVECDIGFFDKKEYHFYWSLTAIRKDISDLKVEE